VLPINRRSTVAAASAATPLVVLAAAEDLSGAPAQVLVLGAFGSLVLLVARQWTVLQENGSLTRRAEEHATELDAAIRQLERERGAATFLASHDPLTSLLNYRGWWEAARSAPVSTVVMFDIDFFKAINDNHGHPAGDEVLHAVAERLRHALAGLGDLGRVGGEEFAFAGRAGADAVLHATAAALDAVRSHPVVLRSGETVSVSLSAGAAENTALGAPVRLEELYSAADNALYDAKHAGRDQLVRANAERKAA
jgi:diguanylate cyclase (GGDEF)-like protein